MGKFAYVLDDGRVIFLDPMGIERLRHEIREAAKVLARHSVECQNAPLQALVAELSESTHWTDERIRNFLRRKTTNTAIPHVGELIDVIAKLRPKEIERELSTVAPSISSEQTPVIIDGDRTLALSFDESLEDQKSFTEEYSGAFLIYRRVSETHMSAALMVVGGRFIHDIARYRTVRPLKNNRHRFRVVDGVAYRSKGVCYTLGRIRNQSDLRLSILRRHARDNLTGVRLGLNQSEDQAYASPIYALKLNTELKNDREIKRFAGAQGGLLTASEAEDRFNQLAEAGRVRSSIAFSVITDTMQKDYFDDPMRPSAA